MGVDINLYTKKYSEEDVHKLYEYAKQLGLEDLVNIVETENVLCSFGSGQEFLIPFFGYKEEYSEKEITKEKIRELSELLKDILSECEDILYNDLHKRLFKTKTLLDDDVVYARKSIKAAVKCNDICDKRLEQYKFRWSDYIKNVDHDYVYPIKFLDVCIVYDHLREILSSTEDKKIFMSASF